MHIQAMLYVTRHKVTLRLINLLRLQLQIFFKWPVASILVSSDQCSIKQIVETSTLLKHENTT
jgi:hypothetical protein